MHRSHATTFLALSLLMTFAIPSLATAAPAIIDLEPGPDPHSWARPREVSVQHLSLDLAVDFEQKRLTGRASLTLDRSGKGEKLVLDSRGLEIQGISLDEDTAATWAIGPERPFLGQAVVVDLLPTTRVVHVDYRTRPDAGALQWLAPAQTSGGQHPFLFTQSQAILARTWIPLQDTPSVRMTYEATIRVPPALMAVMSAENPIKKSEDGVYRFRMPQAIPSYLMALAVGDLAFRSMGMRTGVYAEPAVVDKAAWEFAETEKMIIAAERLYGVYRWGRYDLLVLPPSFPFGGMENPRLTFATPTILAGDRSLVSLVAHELAHSWSGNLVTNATWNDFWLNEGFTVYFEQRIMEEVYGRPYAEMLASLGLTELENAIAEYPPGSPDTHLLLDLAGRDPDDGVTAIAYQKGYFFLRTLEAAVGRAQWDPFLQQYFDTFGFRSVTTKNFLFYLKRELPLAAQKVNLDEWAYGPGLPASADRPKSDAFAKVEAEVARFAKGTKAKNLVASEWTTHEKLHFLAKLPKGLKPAQLADLDQTFGLSTSGNSEILCAWLEVTIAHAYQPANEALERFLTQVGRRKFLRPLYNALAKTPEGKAMANRIYAKARPGYHSVAVNTVDGILGWQDGQPPTAP
ncbi:MAG TPA: M1 family metallopeptidase [Thermoanaerobaculia bacterium]|nr:M1 family metallopeptidase [Thermoanaerobaculia bacterium]